MIILLIVAFFSFSASAKEKVACYSSCSEKGSICLANGRVSKDLCLRKVRDCKRSGSYWGGRYRFENLCKR